MEDDMLKILSIIASLFSLGIMAGTPVEVFVPVEHIFSPVGFDNNEQTLGSRFS